MIGVAMLCQRLPSCGAHFRDGRQPRLLPLCG